MAGDDANFPLETNNRFIGFLQKVIQWNVQVLALLMVLVILWAVADLISTLYKRMIEPPILFVDMEGVLKIFGGFLIVLMAIEIFLNIILYLKKNIDHSRLVLATAIMAIARKVIILDYDHISGQKMVGIAALILALGTTYWFLSRLSQSPLIRTVASSPDEK